MNNVEKIIRYFNMKPLPDEGGYYTETYRSKEKIVEDNLPDRYKGYRNYYTSIVYLITEKNFSHLHRIKSDEIFHFYMGKPVEIINFLGNGKYRKVTLGNDIFSSQRLQYMVPKNTWQAAYLKQGRGYALLGTTVSPGFEFKDYQNAKKFKEKLTSQYPELTETIERII